MSRLSVAPPWAVLLLVLLLLLLGLLGWLWQQERVTRVYAQALEKRVFLLECAAAVEQARDNVTEQIAPLEGKTCGDPLLAPARLQTPQNIASSEITVNRTLEPYSEGEYRVTLRTAGGEVWTLERGGQVQTGPTP